MSLCSWGRTWAVVTLGAAVLGYMELSLLNFQMQIAEYALGTGRKVHVGLRCERN